VREKVATEKKKNRGPFLCEKSTRGIPHNVARSGRREGDVGKIQRETWEQKKKSIARGVISRVPGPNRRENVGGKTGQRKLPGLKKKNKNIMEGKVQ